MILTGVKLLVWLVALVALVTLASWSAYRSWRRFARQARGPGSTALPCGEPKTALDQMFAPLEAANPGQSGLANLLDNSDAFAARALSAQAAGRSLDLMYYIWRTDLTGWLLLADLMAAADRGVRIRLLLDDVNVQGFDPAFLALNQHPNIAVRLFNPTRNRGNVIRRVLEMLLGMTRFNRRMHGKLWIADGRLAILGGRNIADSYFGALEGGARNARDADVMLTGARVAEVSAVFDSYWNLGLALPILTLWPRFRINTGRFRRRLARHAGSSAARRFHTQSVGARDPTQLAARLHWTDQVQVLADPPEKAYGQRTKPWMADAIAALLDGAKREVRLITPYFVPGTPGLERFTALLAGGVRVRLLTNALAATDHVLVHGAYRIYRGPLLTAGASIHEFAPPRPPGGRRDVLHSKVFIIDGRQAVVGSLNLDLRSALTNTELGLQFEEPELVAELLAHFDRLAAPDQAYALALNDGRLHWSVARPGLPTRLDVEPEARWRMRALSWIIGHLPIHGYL